MTPQEIVSELDKHIVGQARAKRAVAIALRNRWRRQQVAEPLRQRDHAEEHPDDRPDRRRQDRDRAPPGAAGRRAVHQGRGDQVHRGRLRRPRRRHDRPRPGRDRGQAGARERRCAQVRARAEDAAEERVLDALLPPARDDRLRASAPKPPRTRRRARSSARSCARASSTTRRSRSRSPPAQPQMEIIAPAGHGGADRSRSRACSRTSAAARKKRAS